jgi:hypothetical protein
MKFYLKKNQINLKLTCQLSFIFLLIIVIFLNKKSLAQSPIKPPQPTPAINDSSAIKNDIANYPQPSMQSPTASALPANPPQPSMQSPTASALSTNPPQPPMQAGIPNPIAIQNNSLGQISAASISNSISNIFGDPNGTQVEALMFDNKELGNINRAIDSLKNNQIYVPEGLDKIEKITPAEEVEKNEENEVEENEKSYIYLGSVIYFAPNDWVIWLNDQKISTTTNNEQKEIYVSSIVNDRIKIRWKMNLSKWKILSGKKDETTAPRVDLNSNIVESEFELRPNQTFILGSNSVVEGKAVIALIKKKGSKEKSLLKKTETTQSLNDSDVQTSPAGNGKNILSAIKNYQQMNDKINENNEQLR